MSDNGLSLADQWSGGHKAHLSEAEDRIEIAKRCLRLVKPIASFENVVDFGCGIGAWMSAAEKLGAGEVIGYEGDYINNTEVVVDRDKIRIADLSQAAPDLGKRYTIAMTIEVAEHLPESAADRFVSTLINASDYVLFSAATPGQGGIGHINEQPLSYWVKKFWSKGYIPIDPIRPYIARDNKIYWWLKQNLIMLVNYDAALRNPDAMRFARPLADFSLVYNAKRDRNVG